jgi:hypothetical protein
MPYIKQDRRDEMDDKENAYGDPITVGELNYKLTMTCLNYLNDKLSYQKLNDVLGALEGCKLEFYRRVVGPYENQKCHDNGDVYT